jgi:hypothetical protein
VNDELFELTKPRILDGVSTVWNEEASEKRTPISRLCKISVMLLIKEISRFYKDYSVCNISHLFKC